jgi:ABC-2 type transport system permease protein
MQAYLAMVRRELSGYFLSLTGWLVIAAATFLMGLSFVVLLVKLQREPTPMPVTELFYVTPFFWLILLLSTPVITMRLFAQERMTGTFETLMTAPVSDLQVVLAKFTAGMIFYIVMWLPLLGCLGVVRQLSGVGTAMDAGAVAATFLGIVLVGSTLIAAGCWASALTRSLGLAAMIALVFGTSLFLIGFLADKLPDGNGWAMQILGGFNVFEQMHDFARGLVDTRPVVLHVTITLFFLFVTLRVVESRRWK